MEPSCVLVTGASGVLGTAVARAFTASGARVLATGFHKPPASTPSIQLDLALADEMPRLNAWLVEQAKRVDVLVHCVGGVRDALVSKMNDEDWKAAFDMNLKSAWLVARAILPRMMKQRSGHLIFVASWGGVVGRFGQSNYAAAKAALVAFTQSLAREYASRDIRANVIVPGVFKSPMMERLTPVQLERLWDGAATSQFADLDETARFIVHLATMRGVTGQVFHLDGRIPPS